MTTIVLLDSQRMFLDAFQQALVQHPSVSVVGATTHARAALELAETRKPDLLVSELFLDDSDASSVGRELRRRHLPVGLVVLTMQTSAVFVHDAAEAGSRGYLLKSQPLADAIAAFERIVREPGFQYLAPSLEDAVMQATQERDEVGPRGVLGRLSRREQEVFYRVLAGDSGRAIARALCISLKTVETHRMHINRKLGVHSPAELIRVAAVAGLLPEAGRLGPRSIVPTSPARLTLAR